MTLDIEVAGLRLRYGTVTALDDLSCKLPGGRIHGLLGRNGSGTTSPMSSSMTLPKPWHVGQAPNGLLNENSRGCGVS